MSDCNFSILLYIFRHNIINKEVGSAVMTMNKYRLGIDIGSTTVKIAILDDNNNILFSDYERHFANIQETLQSLLEKAVAQLGEFEIYPVITGSGGLTLAKHLEVPFTQEVVAVSTALQDYAPQCDVAIELGGEDAKIIYFTNGIDQRMNGIPFRRNIILKYKIKIRDKSFLKCFI